MSASSDGRRSLLEAHAGTQARPSVQHLLAVIDRLAEIARSELPPDEKLEFLCAQIGIVQFRGEQIRDMPEPGLRGPHVAVR